ncbi:hypothetical protein BAY1663_02355 [Pseudomonas sp. BAY1663]|uniref:DUF2460 domain-containing protein n=1 Tax=Pseudomonas sp. BAY1663 TaxID=1439940 RepID=UPI00042E0310|nr:DUF2460 domain-containing protein [Pseudomonas sp. BAY1663]EXF45276.1 hypothetical protein BAY1663_02355 [Pseudomonas sp. BAY1663]
MGQFIEERLSVCVRLGAEYEDSYFVDVVNTSGGGRYSSLKNALPFRIFEVDFVQHGPGLEQEIASLYHRTYGGFAGFRVKAWKDFTTAIDGVSVYAGTDCALLKISAGVYQLQKEYGRDKPGLASIGRPKRLIYKPVADEVAIAVNGQILPAAQWSVDTTTGRITLAVNKSRAITAISQAAQAVVDVGSNTFLVGESVVFSGVTGMTQINGLRGVIVAKPSSNQVTVNINTALFSAYVSGGTLQTHPLDTGTDIVTGGCEFDIPAAFDSSFRVSSLGNSVYGAGTLRLVEILNP